ncbi:MAG: MFS transporter [Firmicutes bacterium HGW-Firmicutes-14]|jgi:MFS family permease|nr:MAG: MFS transporter [Firmicutes bacterium HGW-Firmicutes-14]
MAADVSALGRNLNKMFPALSHKNFRYFWFGHCISLLGTWMQRTAQQWLVYSLTKSALLLGFLGVAQFGPVLLFSLFAGVIIDRCSKKRMIIFTQTALMIQAFTLMALVWSGHVRYWHVLVLAALLGLMNSIDMPARQSFIINLVGRNDLTNAIALNSAVFNAARIAGPALSAILLVRFGVGFCFFINGLSFIPVIFGLFMIKYQSSGTTAQQGRIINDILDGLKYIKSKPVILSAILALVAVGTFAMNMDVIIPVFSDRILHRGAQGYGFLLSAIGFFHMMFMTLVNSTIQLNVSDSFRGRVMSVYTLSFAGAMPFGNFFAGSVMERFGASAGFLVCGAATGLSIAALVLWMFTKQTAKTLCEH